MSYKTLKINILFLSAIFFVFSLKAQNWEAVPLVSQKIIDNGNSGGEGCQWPQAIEADKTDGSFLLFGTDVGGIYRSTNGGELWEPCNIGYNPRGNCGFAIDPHNNQRALAVGGNSIENNSHGIYLTTNQAASWKHVHPEKNYTGYRNYKDQISFDGSSFTEEPGYSAIAYWSNPAGGLFKSTDGGETWSKINNEFGDCILKVSPDNGTIYIGTITGLYKSTDGGINFSQVFSGVIKDIAIVYTEPSKVWVTTARELYISEDNGETFNKIESTNYPSNVVALEVSPANPDKIIVCNSAGDYSKPIYSSVNGGFSWQIAKMDNTNAFMPFNGRQHELAWHPTDENKVWAFGGDWITSSSDGGKKFEWDANGYTGILVGGKFNFNVSNPDLLYVASQDYNGAFTDDGGETWRYCNASGLGWGGFTYGAYAASENVLVTQVASGWHQPGVLTISHNGGSSFTKTSLVCNGMQVGCGDAKDPDIIYFSEYYSKDLGETWATMDGCKGVIIANLYGEKEVYGANGNSLVKSTDKGDTWEVVATLPRTIDDVAVDHINKRLYIVTSGDRLFQFENGNLEEITSRIPKDQYNNLAVSTVTVDPNNPEIVYCAGPKNMYKTDASVKRSMDGGKTWDIITPNLRTNNGTESGDGANEVFALRVNPITRDLWCAGGCYGVWKEIPENKMTIKMTNPSADTIFLTNKTITFEAEVLQNENPVSKVEFFSQNGFLGADTSLPFQFEWENIKSGNYEFYAKVTDNTGNTAFSATILVKVQASLLPVISIISPVNDTNFEYLQDIEIIANANDPDGQITKVEFYNGDEKLGEDTDSTFTFSWKNVTEGTYTITAKVTDNTNQTVTSAPVTINVKDADGTITYVEDFDDGEAQEWIPVTGSWEIISNQYRNSTSGGIETSVYHGSTFADYTFSAKAKSDWDNNFGLLFNYIDENNFYLLELDASPKTAYLKMITNGNENIIATAEYTGGGAGVYIPIEVINDGSHTTVKINDTTVFNQVLTPDISFGKIGFYSWWNPVWFDDVQVKAKGKILYDNVKLAQNPELLSIYPNPARKQFYVEFLQKDNKDRTIEIFNLLGNKIHSELISENKFSVSINKEWQPGIYIVKVKDFSGLKKLIIQN